VFTQDEPGFDDGHGLRLNDKRRTAIEFMIGQLRAMVETD